MQRQFRASGTSGHVRRTFRQLEGFGSYGFPESHAASFALIAYASSWMKCHHPDVFLAAILNAQPMGFYAPAQLVRDARGHGVEVRPVDVNLSDWDCTLEPTSDALHAVRLGFCMVRSLNEKDAQQLVERRTFSRIATSRAGGRFATIEEVWRRAAVPVSTLRHIAAADGFRRTGLIATRCKLGHQGAAGRLMRNFDDRGEPLRARRRPFRESCPAPDCVVIMSAPGESRLNGIIVAAWF
jgi:DNA polymerase III alpha subunit